MKGIKFLILLVLIAIIHFIATYISFIFAFTAGESHVFAEMPINDKSITIIHFILNLPIASFLFKIPDIIGAKFQDWMALVIWGVNSITSSAIIIYVALFVKRRFQGKGAV